MEFMFPDVGEGIGEGKLVNWKVREGDTIQADQPLAEVETDKAVVEIPSPRTAKIEKLHHAVGDVVKVGEPLVTFSDGPSDTPPTPKDEEHARAPERGTKKIESNLAPTAPKTEEHQPPLPTEHVTDAQGLVSNPPARVLATPSTRRYAREKNIAINTIHGTGPAGRVTKQDIDRAANHDKPQSHGTEHIESTLTPTPPASKEPARKEPEQEPSAPAPKTAATPGDTIPYTGIRKTIGEHMQAAHSVPHVTETVEANISLLVELRNHLKARAAEEGAKLTYLALFAKAIVAALHKHPVINSRWTDDGITTYKEAHLGIAVDTDYGLVVPVIKNADDKNIVEIAQDIERLAAGARNKTLSPEELSGSTFSISNIGPRRVEAFTPLINTPETAILGIGAITEKPVVHEGTVVPGKTVTFSLTFDHRAFDGAKAADFLQDLAEIVEDPELFLLEGV